MVEKKYKEKDGIIIFHDDINENHTDYNLKGLDSIFQEEERHFWFLARKEFIFQEMKNRVAPMSRIIEIGAGTGNVSRYLKHKGYLNISVGEMHIEGLKYAKSYGLDECYQFDLLRTPFKNEFESICIFDVLEHIENDNLALKNIHKMLKSNGQVILTVPAHIWLWSRDDVIAGHKKRYTKRELVLKLQNLGFDIEVAKYFFITIVPLLWLRRLLNKDIKNDMNLEKDRIDLYINPFISKILLILSRFENKINKFLPNFFGGSLFIIARKK